LNPTLLAGFKAALDAETNPENPLSTVDPGSIDEFLSRINDDLAAGMPQKITGDRLDQLINLFRVEAVNWEMAEQATGRAPRGTSKKKSPVEVEGFDTSGLVF